MILANIFQPLVDVFESVLVFFHDNLGTSWGLSIILLTICVRALLLPLAVKQFRSMRALQRIAPDLKKLQEKYKDDKERRNQETMKFYQEHKVNPAASCLPLVAQFPVFISLFYMLRKDLRHDICPDINPSGISNPKPCGSTDASQFWFIHDITNGATGGVLVTLLVLYVGSQLISGLLTMQMNPTADKNMQRLTLVLPLFFVAFVYKFPAGLIMYWITTNVWTIGQQQFLGRVIGRKEPPLPKPDPSDSLFARLSGAMQDAQQGGNGKTAAGNGGSVSAAKATAKKGSGKGSGEGAGTRVTKAPPPPPRQRSKKRSGKRR